jgi:hypothetical protein
MKLVSINWHPTQAQLRQFSVIGALLLPLIGWLWGADEFVLKCLVGAGLLIAVVGIAIPAVVKPLFLLLTIVTIPIGLIVSELAMVLIYFGVFLPISLLFRGAGRDALQRRFDPGQKSYWQAKKQPPDVASYFRQS